VREEGRGSKPPQLRLRILRENDRPFEISLHLVERPAELPVYHMEASPWNGSVAGFELEFSFDKKTWKRVGRSVKKVMP